MSPLIESIKLRDGRLYNLDYHNRRFNEARKEYFGISLPLDIGSVVFIPEDKKSGLFRCRVTYSPAVEKVEIIPHVPRVIKSLKMVVDNSVDYRFKYSDRGHLEQLFNRRGHCDDILIIKNGCITDSFTANPVFFDGQKWWVPDTPLLKGTQRARLLEENKISECRITPACLTGFEKAGLINIFWDLDNMPVVEVGSIF